MTGNMSKFALLELVGLARDLTNDDDIDISTGEVHAGDVGTVVEIYHVAEHLAYEVEFVNDEGRTIALVVLPEDALCKVT